MADGSRYVVPHPDYLSVAPGPRARAAIFYEADGRTMHLIDLGLVSEIITEVPAEGSGIGSVSRTNDS
jgi:hypothetical protein